MARSFDFGLAERAKNAPDERPDVSTTSIRAALDQLCEARLVWRGDGPYALEESQFASWLLERQPIDPASTLLNAALRAPAIDAA